MVQKRTTPLDWSDLSALLAVARAGSARTAAGELGVSHTTLVRRVERAEAALGTVAFVRSRQGYVLTDSGRAIVAHAERMDEEADALQRAVGQGDTTLRGLVRVTLPRALLAYAIAPAAPAFLAANPELELEFLPDERYFDLDRHDADIAVRIQTKPKDDLVGLHIGTAHEAAYASKRFAASLSRSRRSEPVPLIAWADNDSVRARAARLGLKSILIRSICVDTFGQVALASAGLGVAILPCLVGDAVPGLVRLERERSAPAHPIWVLRHPDLVRSAKVSAVVDFLATTLRAVVGRG